MTQRISIGGIVRRLRDRGNGDRQRYRWSMSDAVGRSETRVGSVTTAGIEGGIGGAQVAKISQEQKKLEVDREVSKAADRPRRDDSPDFSIGGDDPLLLPELHSGPYENVENASMGPLSSTGPGSDLGSKTGAGYKQLPLTIENLALLDDLQQQQHTPAAGVTVNKIHTNEWDRNHVGDGGNWSQGAPQTVGEGVYSALASSGTSDNPSFALSETLYDGSGGLKDATKPQGFNTVDSTVQSPDKFGHTPLDPPDDSPSLEDVGLDSALNFPKPPLDFSTVPKDTSESHSPKGSLSSRSKTKSKSATDEWSGMYCTPTILRGMSQAGSIRSALSSAKSVAMSVRSIFGSGASPFSPSLESPKALAGDYGESKETKRERRRESHNKVERRRRDNINERIQELKQLTPSHRIADQKIQKAVLENPQAANWTSSAPIIQLDEVGPNKGDILNGAVGWIRDLIWMAAVSNQRENMLKAMISEQDRRLIPIWSDSLMRMRSELATIYENDKNKPLEYSRALGTCLYVPPLTTLIGMSREDDRYQQTLEWQEKVFAGLELERQHLLPKPPLSLESNIGPLKPATMPHRNSKSSWSTRGAAILTFLSLYLVLTTIFLGIDSETPHVKQAAILFNGILIVALSLVWARNFEIKAMSAIFRTNKSTVEWLFSPRAVVTRLWKVLPNCYSICRDSHRLARKNISVRRWHTLDPSKTRVMWKCKCGKELYDDFQELKYGSVARLEERLRSTNPQRVENPSSGIRGSLWSAFDGIASLLRLGRNKKPSSRGPMLPQDNSQTDSADIPPTEPPSLSENIADLHLCVNSGRYAMKLVYLDVNSIKTDQQLFDEMKKRRDSLSSRIRSIFSLYNLRTIKFVRFVMHKMDFVDIKKQDDIPPVDKLSVYKYQYDPIPPEYVPPVGENHLMHLYLNPECANDEHSTLLSLFPKKVYERLMLCQKTGMSTGWGIQFVEGWNWDRIWPLSIAILVLGGIVFAVAWSVLEHDIQGAFSVASYMTVLLSLAIGLVQVKSLPDG